MYNLENYLQNISIFEYVALLSEKSVKKYLFLNYLSLYLHLIYRCVCIYHYNFWVQAYKAKNSFKFNTHLTYLLILTSKFVFLSSLIYNFFFLATGQKYLSQLKQVNVVLKFFLLNDSEKEVGPVDDLISFTILFITTIISFILFSIFCMLTGSKSIHWTLAMILIIAFLILTIPLNLLIDFGLYAFAYVRGSSTSTSLLREFVFDIIATTTIFIRFIIQNIRFLFIFIAIFELLEWTINYSSNLFLTNYFLSTNLFVNTDYTNYLYNHSNINILLINSILTVIFYFYYFLHLLFLLIIQISVYIGISIWLFFFLYSTKFLTKYEKYFSYKNA